MSGDYQILRISDDMQFQGDYRKSPIIPEEVVQITVDAVPEIHNYCRLNRRWSEISIRVGDDFFFNDLFFYADSTVNDFFPMDYIYGDYRASLTEPYTAIITNEIAEAYFGDADPVGQTFEVLDDHTYRVTGVINAKNRRSHFNFSILASYSSTSGTHPWVYSYIKVPSNADQEHLKSTIDRVSQDLLSEKY